MISCRELDQVLHSVNQIERTLLGLEEEHAKESIEVVKQFAVVVREMTSKCCEKKSEYFVGYDDSLYAKENG